VRAGSALKPRPHQRLRSVSFAAAIEEANEGVRRRCHTVKDVPRRLSTVHALAGRRAAAGPGSGSTVPAAQGAVTTQKGGKGARCRGRRPAEGETGQRGVSWRISPPPLRRCRRVNSRKDRRLLTSAGDDLRDPSSTTGRTHADASFGPSVVQRFKSTPQSRAPVGMPFTHIEACRHRRPERSSRSQIRCVERRHYTERPSVSKERGRFLCTTGRQRYPAGLRLEVVASRRACASRAANRPGLAPSVVVYALDPTLRPRKSSAARGRQRLHPTCLAIPWGAATSAALKLAASSACYTLIALFGSQGSSEDNQVFPPSAARAEFATATAIPSVSTQQGSVGHVDLQVAYNLLHTNVIIRRFGAPYVARYETSRCCVHHADVQVSRSTSKHGLTAVKIACTRAGVAALPALQADPAFAVVPLLPPEGLCRQHLR